jgi:hypothetical protein
MKVRGFVAAALAVAAIGTLGVGASAAESAARADVVVQRGEWNYAGPSCPGAGWTCTTAPRVVQLGSINVSECTPGEIEDPGQTCEIEQFGPGDNTAVCRLRTEEVPNAFQLCRIKQSTSDGTNLATVRMVIVQSEGSVQIGEQRAHIDQTNEHGDNRVRVRQEIDQTVTTGLIQAQDGRQVADADQINDEGINFSNIDQSLVEEASASSSGAQGTIAQCQNGDPAQTTNPACALAPSSDFDSEMRVDQAGRAGKNHSRHNQVNRLRASATSTEGGVVQTQGGSLTEVDSGISGEVIQVAPEGQNFTAAEQEKTYKAFADTPGALVQQQYDGMKCCAEQTGPGSVSITQRSTLRATPGGDQLVDIRATCSVPLGVCTTDSVGSDNHDQASATCEGTSCSEFVECSNLPEFGALASLTRSRGRTEQDTCTSSDEEES